MRINGHGHILPEPSQIPRFLKEKKLFWIDDDKKFMRQGDWSRPINGASFFVKEKIEWMNKYNIDHGVMLCLSQLYCNGWQKKDCEDGIRFQNDFNASVQNIEPTSFALYPNPAGNHIYLNGAENAAQYTITDGFGRTCLEGKLCESKQIMIDELQPGIYFIETNGQVLKFQVQH